MAHSYTDSLAETTAAPDYRISRPGGLVPSVVVALTRRIVNGEFDDDVPFPHSAELVDQFGVSRTVVREALRVLEAKHLISIQQGRHTVVLPSDRWDLLDPVVISVMTESDVSLGVFNELAHVRAALEADMAYVAAERLAPFANGAADEEMPARARLLAAYDDLDAAYKELDDSQEAAAHYLSFDQAFHESVMALAENRFARRIVHQVFGWARRGSVPEVRRGDLEVTHADHTAIMRFIVDGRPDDAQKAMRDHILLHWAAATRDRLEKGLPGDVDKSRGSQQLPHEG